VLFIDTVFIGTGIGFSDGAPGQKLVKTLNTIPVGHPGSAARLQKLLWKTPISSRKCGVHLSYLIRG
jgi:hypothetical protein